MWKSVQKPQKFGIATGQKNLSHTIQREEETVIMIEE
jgi:hypothetical protein